MSARFACPCCGYLTMGEAPPGTYLICPVCSWEDDLVQYDDPNFEGGANQVSLNTARINFKTYGARSETDCKHVRKPYSEELP